MPVPLDPAIMSLASPPRSPPMVAPRVPSPTAEQPEQREEEEQQQRQLQEDFREEQQQRQQREEEQERAQASARTASMRPAAAAAAAPAAVSPAVVAPAAVSTAAVAAAFSAAAPSLPAPSAASPAAAGVSSPAAAAAVPASVSDGSSAFPVFRNQVAGHSPLLWHRGTICKPLHPTEYAFYAHLIPGELSALVPYTPKFYGILDMSFIPEAFEKQQQERDQRRAEKALVLRERERREQEARNAAAAAAAATAAAAASAAAPASQPVSTLPTSVSIPLSLSLAARGAPADDAVAAPVVRVPSLPHSLSSSPIATTPHHQQHAVEMNTWVLQCQNRTRDKNNRMHSADDAAAVAHAAAVGTDAAAQDVAEGGKAHTLPASFSLTDAAAAAQDASSGASRSPLLSAPSSMPVAASPAPGVGGDAASSVHPPMHPSPAPLPSSPPTPLPQYIVLEDLTFAYDRPCILDLKLGTRQHGIGDSAKKIASKIDKCNKTTSGKLGIRLCGMQVFHPSARQREEQADADAAGSSSSGGASASNSPAPNNSASQGKFIYYDKYFGRSLSEESFLKTLKLFFWNGQKLLLHIMLLFLERLHKLRAILELRQMSKYRFYSSSLLMVYEGQTSKTDSASLAAAAAAAAAAATGGLRAGEAAMAASSSSSAASSSASMLPRNNHGASHSASSSDGELQQPAGKEHYPAAASLSSCSRLNDIVERSLSFAASGSGGAGGMPRSHSIDVLSSAAGTPSASSSLATLDQSGFLTPPPRPPFGSMDLSPPPHARALDTTQSPLTPATSPLPPMHHAHGHGAASSASAAGQSPSLAPQHLDVEDIAELRQILQHEQERIADIRRGYHALVEQKQAEERMEAECRMARLTHATHVAAVAGQALATSTQQQASTVATTAASAPADATAVQQQNARVLVAAQRCVEQESAVVHALQPHPPHVSVAQQQQQAHLLGTPTTATPASSVASSTTPQAVFSPSDHISYLHVGAITPQQSTPGGASSTAGSASVGQQLLTPHPSPQPPSPYPIPTIEEDATHVSGNMTQQHSHLSARSFSCAPASSASPLPPHPRSLSPSVPLLHTPVVPVVLPPSAPMHSAPSAPAATTVPKLYTRVRKTTHAVARERARLKGNIDIRLIDYAQVVVLEDGQERPLVRECAHGSHADAATHALACDGVHASLGITPPECAPGAPCCAAAAAARTCCASPAPAASSATSAAARDGGVGDPGLLIGVTNLIYFISSIVTQEISAMLAQEQQREQAALMAHMQARAADAPGTGDAADSLGAPSGRASSAGAAVSGSSSSRSADANSSAALSSVPTRTVTPPLHASAGSRSGSASSLLLSHDSLLVSSPLPPCHSSPLASSSHTAAFSSSHVPRKHSVSSAASTEPRIGADPVSVAGSGPTPLQLPESAHGHAAATMTDVQQQQARPALAGAQAAGSSILGQTSTTQQTSTP